MVEQTVIFGLQMMNNFGIGLMVGEIGRALTPENAGKVVKACIYVGSVGTGWAIASRGDKEIEKYVGEIFEAGRAIKKMVKKGKGKKDEEDQIVVEVEAEKCEDEEIEEKTEEVVEEQPKKAKKKTK